MSMVDSQATMVRERLARRRRRRLWARVGTIALVIILVGAAGLYRFYTRSVGDGDPEESVNILIAVAEGALTPGDASHEGAGGNESGQGPAGRTDAPSLGASGLQAAAVLTIHPEEGKVTVISLPAATRIDRGGEGEDPTPPTVDHGAGPTRELDEHSVAVTAEGPVGVKAEEPVGRTLTDVFEGTGLAGLRIAVEALLETPVHHYVQVDPSAFAALVDRLPRGVPVTVRDPIVYRDASGEEIFRLDEGEHVLDGRAALYYLRYRGDDWYGEVPRARRQREFVESLMGMVLREGGVQGIRDMLNVAQEQVVTDLGAVQSLRLFQMIRQGSPDFVTYRLLPGRAEAGQWVPDEGAVKALVARTFHHPSRSVATSR